MQLVDTWIFTGSGDIKQDERLEKHQISDNSELLKSQMDVVAGLFPMSLEASAEKAIMAYCRTLVYSNPGREIPSETLKSNGFSIRMNTTTCQIEYHYASTPGPSAVERLDVLRKLLTANDGIMARWNKVINSVPESRKVILLECNLTHPRFFDDLFNPEFNNASFEIRTASYLPTQNCNLNTEIKEFRVIFRASDETLLPRSTYPEFIDTKVYSTTSKVCNKYIEVDPDTFSRGIIHSTKNTRKGIFVSLILLSQSIYQNYYPRAEWPRRKYLHR